MRRLPRAAGLQDCASGTWFAPVRMQAPRHLRQQSLPRTGSDDMEPCEFIEPFGAQGQDNYPHRHSQLRRKSPDDHQDGKDGQDERQWGCTQRTTQMATTELAECCRHPAEGARDASRSPQRAGESDPGG